MTSEEARQPTSVELTPIERITQPPTKREIIENHAMRREHLEQREKTQTTAVNGSRRLTIS